MKLYSTSKIEDVKQEKIAFVIDMYSEIKSHDFLTVLGDKKITRLEAIVDEIVNYIKIKDYFSNNTEFALYTYANGLKKECSFCQVASFIDKMGEFKSTNCKEGENEDEDKIKVDDYIDVGEIYSEGYSFLAPLMTIDSFARPKSNENDFIIRFIFFYSRSKIIPHISDNEKYNLMNFVRMPNFVMDVVFLRKKANNEEDKKTLSNTFKFFKNVKPKFWYLFENSGNIMKLKFQMNLLLAYPGQRIKLENIDKYQKKVEELIKNTSSDD